MGRNGAAKSTLLKMVAGQVAPYRGAVTLGASLVMGYFALWRGRRAPGRASYTRHSVNIDRP